MQNMVTLCFLFQCRKLSQLVHICLTDSTNQCLFVCGVSSFVLVFVQQVSLQSVCYHDGLNQVSLHLLWKLSIKKEINKNVMLAGTIAMSAIEAVVLIVLDWQSSSGKFLLEGQAHLCYFYCCRPASWSFIQLTY